MKITKVKAVRTEYPRIPQKTKLDVNLFSNIGADKETFERAIKILIKYDIIKLLENIKTHVVL